MKDVLTFSGGGHRPLLQPWWLCGSNVSIQGCPRPFKAIKGYPSLFKGFWKKNWKWWAEQEPVLRQFKVF
jgi:hypothetical protein